MTYLLIICFIGLFRRALRVIPAETRLTVYRRSPVIAGELPGLGLGGLETGTLYNLALKIIIFIILCSEIKNSR